MARKPKRPSMGDALRAQWQGKSRRAPWEYMMPGGLPPRPLDTFRMHEVHGNDSYTMLEKAELSRLARAENKRRQGELTEWWELFNTPFTRRMNKEWHEQIKYDMRAPVAGGRGARLAWYVDNMGLESGQYPEPKDDPFNRLQAAADTIFTKKTQNIRRTNKRGKVYYRGRDFWADNLFRTVLRDDYGIDIMGSEAKWFDWERYREIYDSIQQGK